MTTSQVTVIYVLKTNMTTTLHIYDIYFWGIYGEYICATNEVRCRNRITRIAVH